MMRAKKYSRRPKQVERWPANYSAAVSMLRSAQIHLAEQLPEVSHYASRHPDRNAIRILESLEHLIRCLNNPWGFPR